MNELYKKLEVHNLIEGDTIVLERYEGGAIQAVDKETFEGYFSATNGTYEALVAVGEPLGYKPFFDIWKEKEII